MTEETSTDSKVGELCEICGETSAESFCETCQQAQCAQCFSFIHSKERNKQHTSTSLSTARTSRIASLMEKAKVHAETTTPKVQNKIEKIPPIDISESSQKQPKSKPINTVPGCIDHALPFSLFCKTCNILICEHCLTGEHAGHLCCQLHEAVKTFSDVLEEKRKNFTEVSLPYDKCLHEIHDLLKITENQKEMSKEAVYQGFKELNDHLNAKEEELLHLAFAQDQPIITLLEEQADLLKRFLSRTQEKIQKILQVKALKETFDEASYVNEMIRVKDSILTMSSKEGSQKPPEFPLCESGHIRSIIVDPVLTSIEEDLELFPCDVFKSFVAPLHYSPYTSVGIPMKLIVHIKDSKGKPVNNVRTHDISVQFLQYPGQHDDNNNEEDESLTSPSVDISKEQVNSTDSSQPPMIILTIDHHDRVGSYQIRVSVKNRDIRRSPFIFNVVSLTPDILEFPVNGTLATAFNEVTGELWIVDNSKSSGKKTTILNKVNCYNLAGNIIRQRRSLPLKAQFIAFDPAGFLYGSDTEIGVWKCDISMDQMKIVWHQSTTSLQRKAKSLLAAMDSTPSSKELLSPFGLTVYDGGQSVLVFMSNGVIAKLSTVNGLLESVRVLKDLITAPVQNILVPEGYDSRLYTTEKSHIKIYDLTKTTGSLVDAVSEIFPTGICCIHGVVYVCQGDKVWKKLVTTRENIQNATNFLKESGLGLLSI